MPTLRHAIEGILLLVSSYSLGQVLISRGVPEGEAKFWTCLFVAISGGGIIWFHRRKRAA